MLSSNTSTCINLAPTNGVCVCVNATGVPEPVHHVSGGLPNAFSPQATPLPHTKPFCMTLGHWHQDPPLLGAVSRPASRPPWRSIGLAALFFLLHFSEVHSWGTLLWPPSGHNNTTAAFFCNRTCLNKTMVSGKTQSFIAPFYISSALPSSHDVGEQTAGALGLSRLIWFWAHLWR